MTHEPLGGRAELIAPAPAVVRRYRSPDDAAATAATFRAAVTRTASADYDPEQVAAWAGPADVDLAAWDARRAATHTVVAVTQGRVVGFTDLLDDGLVDMLFVHPDAGGHGMARLLVEEVRQEARRRGLVRLHTHASRTAQPVLAHLGFRVVAERPDNRVRGVVVPNAEMACDLGAAAG